MVERGQGDRPGWPECRHTSGAVGRSAGRVGGRSGQGASAVVGRPAGADAGRAAKVEVRRCGTRWEIWEEEDTE